MVKLLYSLFLSDEITIFPIHVRVFVMDKEKVVVVSLIEVGLKLFLNRLSALDFGHTHELR